MPGVCLAQAFAGRGNWCLVLDEVENCTFNTADACYAAAYDRGGYCKENARKSRVSGTLPWCVISESGRDCNYYIQETCVNQARTAQGGCVQNTERELELSQLQNKYAGLTLQDLKALEKAEQGEQSLSENLQEAQKMQEQSMEGAAQ